MYEILRNKIGVTKREMKVDTNNNKISSHVRGASRCNRATVVFVNRK